MQKIAQILSQTEEKYFNKTDWEVKENANESPSFGNFLSYFLDKTLKQPSILSKVFPSQAVSEHFDGGLHIHKLPYSLYVPYCAGWSFSNLLEKGLKTPTLTSKPAEHLDSAINQLVNYIFLTAQEWSGAMAVSAFDLLTAPFVREDNLRGNQIKQALQSMLFELNYPSRMGFQSPFSNITIVLDTVKDFSGMDAVIGGKKVGILSDYLDEAIRVTKQLIMLYNEGDNTHAPFTFPIPTLMLTKNFDWNNTRWDGLTDMIFENLAKRGSFYLLNGYASNVEALYAMCCRLTVDISKLNKLNLFTLEEQKLEDFLEERPAARGIWAIPDATGSIGVITINLPRLAFLSKGEDGKFRELLVKELELARTTLKKMRGRYLRSLASGLMPMTKTYLGTLSNHFSTFGLVGLPEAAANFLRNPNLWENLDEVEKAVKWMQSTVKFVREYSESCEKEDGVLYNVEEVPAESTGYRLAMLDYHQFKRAVERKEFFMPLEDGVPFYSNSVIPYYAPIPVAQRAKWEGEVQQEFTGGVMMHLFLYESPDPQALKKLVKSIVTNTKVVYFSITPTIAVCKRCGWSGVGIYDKCPKCGGPVELWSRIVGYYRPIKSWNVGKQAEFLERAEYAFNKRTISTKEALGKKI